MPLPEHDPLDFTEDLAFTDGLPGPFLPADEPVPEGISPRHHDAAFGPMQHEISMAREGSLSQARSITEPLSCTGSEQLPGSFAGHVSSVHRSRHGEPVPSATSAAIAVHVLVVRLLTAVNALQCVRPAYHLEHWCMLSFCAY